MLRRPLTVLVLTFVFVGCTSTNQPQPQEQPSPAVEDMLDVMVPATSAGADELHLDESITKGVLSNGLTYIIRHNEKPADRVELRLVVDAGSILEDDDQRGLAHFLEHMAFNGTNKFEKQELVDYLESIGTRFGPDLNAYTSFDETVYMLQVRSDSSEILDTGLEILREWASEISLDPDEVEKERGVVIEEWRLGRGASARIFDQQIPVLLQGSRYVDRLPIGLPEVIESFPHDRLSDFYARWYRPDLMAVVVVGDVDTEVIQQRIIELFSNLAPSETGTERPVHDVPDHDETLYIASTDPEAPYSSLSLVYKHDARPFKTSDDFRTRIVEQLFSDMFNSRLDELRQQADPPFIVAGAGSGSYVRTKDVYNVNAIVQEGNFDRAHETLLTEVERVRRHGFTATEFDRAVTSYVRWYESAYNERDKTESEVFASEYVRHFLEDEAVPGIEREFELVQSLISSISLDEVNAEADHWLTTTNRVVMLSGPEGGMPLPDETQILAMFDSVKDMEVEPYEDRQSDAPLLPADPVAGSVEQEEINEAVGTTTFVLSNGARVILKPTDFKNDQVLFGAFSAGGTSLYPDELDTPADFASALIGQSGIGDHGPIELEKKLSGKIVSVNPSIGEMSESLSGGAAPSDLETLFELIHGFVAYPRADSTLFESYSNRVRSLVESFSVDPNRVFADTLSVTLSQNHPRRRPLTVSIIDELDLEKSLEIYRDRFADVSDFTFYFVGAFDITPIRPLIEKYIASLPGTGREETWADLGVSPPSGVVEKVVQKGLEPQARVQMVITGPTEWSLEQRRLMSALGNVVDIRLREVLREDLGGTYGVQVGGSVSRHPENRFSFSIGFGCAPDRVDELVETVLTELEVLRTSPVDESYIQKTREMMLNGYEQGLESNQNWLQWLQFYDRNGIDPENILTGIPDFVDSLTSEQVLRAAQEFLDVENYVQAILIPENGG